MDVLGNTNQLLLVIVLPKPVLLFMLTMKNVSIKRELATSILPYLV